MSELPPIREWPVSNAQLLLDHALYGMALVRVDKAPDWLIARAAEEMRAAKVRERYPPGPWPFQRSNTGRRT